MIEGSMTRRIGGTVLAFTATLLAAGCGPVYLSDTYATSTPRPESFNVGACDRGCSSGMHKRAISCGNRLGKSPWRPCF